MSVDIDRLDLEGPKEGNEAGISGGAEDGGKVDDIINEVNSDASDLLPEKDGEQLLLDGLSNLGQREKVVLLPLLLERLKKVNITVENILLTLLDSTDINIGEIVASSSQIYKLLDSLPNLESENLDDFKVNQLFIDINSIIESLDGFVRTIEKELLDRFERNKNRLVALTGNIIIEDDDIKGSYPPIFNLEKIDSFDSYAQARGFKGIFPEAFSQKGDINHPLTHIKELISILSSVNELLLEGEKISSREIKRLEGEEKLVQEFVAGDGYGDIDGLVESKGPIYNEEFGRVLTDKGRAEVSSRRSIAFLNAICGEDAPDIVSEISSIYDKVTGFNSVPLYDRIVKKIEPISDSISIHMGKGFQELFTNLVEISFGENSKVQLELCTTAGDGENINVGVDCRLFSGGNQKYIGTIVLFSCTSKMFRDDIESDGLKLVQLTSRLLENASKKAMLDIGEPEIKNRLKSN